MRRDRVGDIKDMIELALKLLDQLESKIISDPAKYEGHKLWNVYNDLWGFLNYYGMHITLITGFTPKYSMLGSGTPFSRKISRERL